MSIAVEAQKARPAPAAADADIAPGVREFCEREGITKELEIALDLLRRHFPMVRPQLTVRRDPECGEEAVRIFLRFLGIREEFSARLRRYTHDWVDLTRWPGTDRFPVTWGIN